MKLLFENWRKWQREIFDGRTDPSTLPGGFAEADWPPVDWEQLQREEDEYGALTHIMDPDIARDAALKVAEPAGGKPKPTPPPPAWPGPGWDPAGIPDNAIGKVHPSLLRPNPKPGVGYELIQFSTIWCPPCKEALQDLRKNNIPWTYIDIEDKSGSAVQWKRKHVRGRKGVPETPWYRSSGVEVTPEDEWVAEKQDWMKYSLLYRVLSHMSMAVPTFMFVDNSEVQRLMSAGHFYSKSPKYASFMNKWLFNGHNFVTTGYDQKMLFELIKRYGIGQYI